MKKCPNCQVDVNDNFDICWNCQYSFVEYKVLENSDFELICPECNAQIEASAEFCPNCNHNLSQIGTDKNDEPQHLKQIVCLRCEVDLEYKGIFRFHEGTTIGKSILFPDLLTNTESFDLYVCPNCGKVEFFIPGFE